MEKKKNTRKKKILDIHIRREFISRNLEYFSKENTYFINEMKLNSKNIIDMIHFDFNSNTIIGFEIKSSQDTVKRLGPQLRTYVTFCNIVYVVVHEKLLEKATEVINKNRLFSDVGIIKVDDNMNFTELKRGNYRKPIFDMFIRNLDSEELTILCESKGLDTAFLNKNSLVNKVKRHTSLQDIYELLKHKLFKYYIKGDKCCNVEITYNKYTGNIIDRYCILCNKLIG